MTTTSKDALLCQRLVGVKIVTGHKTAPCCRAIYEQEFLTADGKYTVRIKYGRPVRTLPSFEELNSKKPNIKRKKQFQLECRVDLEPSMIAAAVLLEELKKACVALDEHHHEGPTP